jgi:phosphoribosylformylglycinamidine synthase
MEGLLMELNKARACVLRVGGTNCDLEVKIALEELGLETVILHINQLKKKKLSEYHMLVFPGGFSYGDFVRAGAIWGREIITKFKDDLKTFVNEEKLVMGICNGFQVLVEAGLLPGNGILGIPTAALANNASAKYECRWIHLRIEERTPFTGVMGIGNVIRIPIGHGEGRFLLPSEQALKDLIKAGQIVFRYAMPNGDPAEGVHPYNPNGATYDIAGICNKKGNVMGMMPHPERAFFGWQLPNWKTSPSDYGDGKAIFEGAIEYLKKY